MVEEGGGSRLPITERGHGWVTKVINEIYRERHLLWGGEGVFKFTFDIYRENLQMLSVIFTTSNKRGYFAVSLPIKEYSIHNPLCDSLQNLRLLFS